MCSGILETYNAILRTCAGSFTWPNTRKVHAGTTISMVLPNLVDLGSSPAACQIAQASHLVPMTQWKDIKCGTTCSVLCVNEMRMSFQEDSKRTGKSSCLYKCENVCGFASILNFPYSGLFFFLCELTGTEFRVCTFCPMKFQLFQIYYLDTREFLFWHLFFHKKAPSPPFRPNSTKFPTTGQKFWVEATDGKRRYFWKSYIFLQIRDVSWHQDPFFQNKIPIWTSFPT